MIKSVILSLIWTMERHVGVGLDDIFDDYIYIDFQYSTSIWEKIMHFYITIFGPKSTHKMRIGFVAA